MERFVVDVPEEVLDDLFIRLARTRFARPTPAFQGDAGISPHYLRELVDFWRRDFDWRAVEARLNGYPQLMVDVGGVNLHAVYMQADAADAPVVVLLHGWPYTFVEMLDVADRLNNATVVVPSLPGFIFSTVPPSYIATSQAIADTVHHLVTHYLGHHMYFVYGEDVGAPVSQWLAATRPESVLGIHDTHAVFPARDTVTSDEGLAFFQWFDAQWQGGKGYAGAGNARHDTIAASLADSPVGLAAWIVEKFRDWSDCEGDVERRFDKTSLLTSITLYWITDTFISSYRPHQSGLVEPAVTGIDVPATVAVQRHEHRYPRSFAEHVYRDLRSFRVMESGGHFTAAEEPDQVAHDINMLIDHVHRSR